MINVRSLANREENAHSNTSFAGSMSFTSMGTRGARVISARNYVEVSKCINTLAAAFQSVPCTVAFSRESAKRGNVSSDHVQAYVDLTIRQSLRAGAALVEAGDTSAVALWELPNHGDESTDIHVPTMSDDEDDKAGPIKKEWKEIVRKAKRKYIGVETSSTDSRLATSIRPHYHLDFLGRNPNVQKVKGAVSAVIQPYLERARQEDLSVWLEATSLDVVPLYQHYGFEVVEEILVGKGHVDDNGEVQTGGAGVRAWLMIIDNTPGL